MPVVSFVPAFTSVTCEFLTFLIMGGTDQTVIQVPTIPQNCNYHRKADMKDVLRVSSLHLQTSQGRTGSSLTMS